ncbi:MAG: HNH endonuclease [candidate division NC10 bacterium]|nr:HNH endonuclease [candidate division NC10 bacterium]
MIDKVKVLVLNQSYEPLHVCTARRAIILLFCGKAQRVEDSHRVISSPSLIIVLPSVIRLNRYIHRPLKYTLAFNKKNILKRDNYTCQYCGRNSGEKLTIDHVLPRSLGGRTVWENVVSACRACNLKKGNKTLQEANMELLRPPARPLSPFHLTLAAYSLHAAEGWQKYLTYNPPGLSAISSGPRERSSP